MCGRSEAKQRSHDAAESGRQQGEHAVADDQERILIDRQVV